MVPSLRGSRGSTSPHRKHRGWSTAWSPEQISNRLKVDFPDDESMRISHEAIYQSLYIQGRGALKRELVWCLRTGRALRAPRERSRRKTWAHVTPGTLISERPAEAEDRAVPGHWEGDLLIRAGALSDRHRRRPHDQIHTAGAPATRGGVPAQGDTQERPRTGRLRCDHDEERVGEHDVDTPDPAGEVADLGSRQGDVRSCEVHGRDRHPGVLR